MGNRCILRAAALLSLGAFGVHQGRYLLGYGDRAESALAAQGHAYLSMAAVPLIVVLLALALATVLVRAVAPARPRARPRLRSVAPACTGALLAIYVIQELAEGTLAAGHPAGIQGVFGHGGWLAIPLAVVAGALVALALRAASAVDDALPAPARIELRFSWPAAWSVAAPPAPARRGEQLAKHLAGRGPPLLCR